MDETYTHITVSYIEGTVSDEDIYNSVGHPNYSGSGLGKRDMEWIFTSSEIKKAIETEHKLNNIPGLTVSLHESNAEGNVIT